MEPPQTRWQSDNGVRTGESVAQVTGNARGVYLLLRSADGSAARVVFSGVP